MTSETSKTATERDDIKKGGMPPFAVPNVTEYPKKPNGVRRHLVDKKDQQVNLKSRVLKPFLTGLHGQEHGWVLCLCPCPCTSIALGRKLQLTLCSL